MKKNVVKIVFSTLVVVMGVFSIIFASVMFKSYSYSYVWHKSYGGDAYTGIQNAAADAANNVVYLGKLCQRGFGYLFIITGVLLIIAGLSCVTNSIINIAEKKKENGSAAIVQNNLPNGYSEKNNDTNTIM